MDTYSIEVYHQTNRGMHTNGPEACVIRVVHNATGLWAIRYCAPRDSRHKMKDECIAELDRQIKSREE